MATNGKQKSLVIIQLSGGNDCLNTVIPYNDERYYDFRRAVRFEPEQVLKLDEQLGLNPNMASIKELWDEGKVAVINGIGYPNPNRSHFRSMDIWHTAEPDKVGHEGWLARAIRELDPRGENVLTGVNFGRGLPRALAATGVPVASVGNLETYGLYPDIKEDTVRRETLNMFAQMYGGAEGKEAIKQFIRQTGTDALKGADILRSAPQRYKSGVEYASNSLAQSLRDVAQVMFADFGTRIYYTGHGGFDTHAGEIPVHSKLWQEVSAAVSDFMDDLEEHGRAEDTLILVFSEFGRRIKDNGSGTDHGSGGVAFAIGGSVKSGLYGEFPSLKPEEQLEGDLHFNNDFRVTYSTILEQWFGLDPAPIVNGTFEQFDFIK
ncbi:MAG: DUF1501 domain-containing protein [Chloroflexi bacterium]|nr:DUF1501 domain-containing protein [Chloroflexota bacterium]